MKMQVRYYSKSGNTKKIADAIGEELKCDVCDIQSAITEKTDIFFLGAAVYKFGIDKLVLNYIDNIDPNLVGEVVIFSTSAMSDSGYPKLVKKLQSKGIKVSDKHFYCKGQFAFANKNRPNESDVENAKKFAQGFLV